MDKDIRQYLHYYLGCDFITPNSQGNLNAQTLHHVIALIENGVKVQLLLRKLESMTDEEMVELLLSMWPPEIDGKPDKDEYILDMFCNDGAVDVDGDVAVGANYSCRCYEGQIAIRQTGDIDLWDEDGKQERVVNITAAFHCLLSKGFDLFNLIESGAAINKEQQ